MDNMSMRLRAIARTPGYDNGSGLRIGPDTSAWITVTVPQTLDKQTSVPVTLLGHSPLGFGAHRVCGFSPFGTYHTYCRKPG